ncbi:MAG: branched-chain amino acid ABC transporter permease [Alphaproteobacteria bacterium]|nr:branched-chain amino acid ABC transporter permease [Alphaproteobacteria bacterium]
MGLVAPGWRFDSNRHGTYAVAGVMVIILFILPVLDDPLLLLKVRFYISMIILSLSMAFIWGFGGIMCFGQSMFFGLGGYAYAISVGNFGESTAPFFLAMIIPGVFAAILGYFMFFGRLNDVYVAVITLAVTLALYYFINSTSGDEYSIGTARLMGFNGISSIRKFNWPGDPKSLLTANELFYFAMGLLIATYVGLKALLGSTFGRVVVAVKENELRAELLGYDVRLYKLAVFVIGATIAGLAGCLSINYKNFISPNAFHLSLAAQIIMWVLVGGVGTLLGPIIGCLVLLYVSFILGTGASGGGMNTYFIFGLIVMIFVLAIPQGIVPTLRDWRDQGGRYRRLVGSAVLSLAEQLPAPSDALVRAFGERLLGMVRPAARVGMKG